LLNLLDSKRLEIQAKLKMSVNFQHNIGTPETKRIKTDLKMPKNFENSLILSEHQRTDLIKLCDFSVDDKFKLIYRGSSHGFGSSDFHSKCDGHVSTLTIAKSTQGYIFGGYTKEMWDDSGHYKNDPTAFLFSLVNHENRPAKIKCNNSYSIFCKNTCGPTFGDGNDLYIANNANSNTSSHSKLGRAYKHLLYEYESEEAQSFLAGSLNFQLSEIEVYTIIRKGYKI
jgi:hypothetical protein